VHRGHYGVGLPVRKGPGKRSDRGVVTQSALAALAGLARGAVAGALLAVVGGLVGGCGMSSLTSGIGGGLFGSQNKTTADVGSISEDQLLAAAKTDGPGSGAGFDVAHGCPRFQVWSREGYVTIYEQGRVGDGLAVMHRGEITKTARECQIEPGRVSVKVGFSGRVLLGPKGKTGNVSLPLTVFVSDAKREKIVTDRVKIDVAVTLDKPIGYFSVVRTVSFNVPEGSRPAEYEVYVAFDRNTPGAG
jgi:hypothetical protein